MGQAITVEELQIVISAQVKDALQGIQQVMTKLQQMMNVKMPDLQRQMQSITVPMQQASAQVRKTTEQSSEAVRKSTEGSKKSLESLYAQLGQLNARLENQRKIYDGLVEKSRSISFKHGDNSLESARIEKSLLTAAETYDRLKAKSDAVRAAIAKLKEPFEQAALAANKCAVSTEKVTGAMAGSDPALNKSEQVIRRVQESMENLAKSTEKYKNIGKLPINDFSGGLAEANAPADQVDKTIQRVRDSTEQARKSTEKYGKAAKSAASKASGAFEKLGKAIKNALIIGVLYKAFRSLFKFISDGIKAAISAPEIENMFNVAFGSMAYQADQFALRLKKAFGVDQIAVKQMLGTFQNFNDSMGIGAQTAYKMSTTLTQLAYDMASLYEMDVNQVYENLQSGLQGMPRALYKYGIAITDANIRQTALRYGIGETGRELTSQEKIIARYITILEQTKNAQGDMARTIESPANQLRILKSQLTAAGRAIGQAFLPFIQAVLPFLNALAVVLERVGNALARFTFRLFGRDFDAEMKEKQEALKNLGDSTGSVAGAQEDLADGINDAKKAAKGALAPFDELTVLQKDMADASVPDMSGGAYEFPDLPTLEPPEGESPYEKMADAIIDKFKKLKEVLMDLGLREVIDNFKDFFEVIGNQFAALDWGTAIKNALENAFRFAMSAINLAQIITFPIIEALNIPLIAFEALNTLSALFGALDDIIRAVTPGMEAFVQIGLVPIAEWIGSKLVDAFLFLQEQLQKVGDWFTQHTDMFTAFGTAIGELANGLWSVVEPLLDAAWEAFKNTISDILDFVLDLAEVLVSVLTPVISVIADILKSLGDWIKKNKKTIESVLEGILKGFIAFKAVEKVRKVLINFTKDFDKLVKSVKGKKIFDAVNNSLKAFQNELGRTGNPLSALGAGLKNAGTQISTFLKNLAPMQKVGVTVAAAAGEFAVVSSAVQGLADGSQSLGGAMLAVVPTIVAVGAALNAMLGPIGLVITAVTAGVAALKGWNDAQTELQTNFINSEFFNNAGTKLDTFNLYLQETYGGIGNVAAKIEELDQAFQNNEKAIFDAQTEIGKYRDVISETGGLTEEQVVKMQGSFDSLITNMQQNLEYNADLVYLAFKQSGEQAAKDLGLNVAEMTTILEGFRQTFSEKTSELESQMQPYWDKLKAGEILTPEDQQKFNELLDYSNELGSKVSENEVKLKVQLQDISKINFENTETAQKKLSEIQETGAQLLSDLDKSKVSALTSIENLKQQAQILFEHGDLTQSAYNQAMEMFNDYALGITEGYNRDKAEIEQSLSGIMGAIELQLNEQLDAVAEETAPTIGNRLVAAVKNGILAFDESDVKEEVAGVVEKSIGTPIRESLDQMAKAFGVTPDQQYGKMMMEGLSQDIKNNSNIPVAEIDNVAKEMDAAMHDSVLDFGSPSKRMIEYGKWTVEGLVQGIKESTTEAKAAIEELVNTLRDTLQAAFSTMDSMGGEGVEVGIMPGQGGMFYQFGMQLMQGLSAGITAGQALVTQAIVAAADTIKTDFKTQFEIEELSGVFTEYGRTFDESLATGITDNTEFVLEALQGLAETIDEHYAEFMEEFSGTFAEDMDELYETLSDTVSSMEESVTDATSQMINSISRLISRIEKAIDRLLELYDLGGSFGGGSGRDKDKSKTSGSGERSISGRTLDIPQLAKGAVLRRPTIVNVAEYAGAMSNPEIVSPRNIMYDTVVEANAPLVSAMSQIANRIITAIEENQPITEIGDDIIYASAKRGARKYNRMIGSII